MYSIFFQKQGIIIVRGQNTKKALFISYSHQFITIFHTNKITAHCIIGVKYIKNIPVLIYGINTQQKGQIGIGKIKQIKQVGFVVIAQQQLQDKLISNISQEISQIQAFFYQGFHYYCDQYDLSLPYYFNKISQTKLQIRQFYDQFVFNMNIAKMDGQKKQQQYSIFWRGCCKIIQGYVHQFTSVLPDNKKIKMIIISRRSNKKSGTRFYSRGIDDEGNVANFTQTQIIYFYDDLIFTHTQIRGSVPAFFSQIGVNGLAGDLVIQRTLPLTNNAFNRHFKRLRQQYNNIHLINLLSAKKSQQLTLSNFYQLLVFNQEKNMPYVKYDFYDFHEQCKNNKFQNSQKLIMKISEIIQQFGFLAFDTKGEKIIKKQQGVFRTNCLDCLDRTNYLQSRISLFVLRMILLQYGTNQIKKMIQNNKLLDLPVNVEYPLLKSFNQAWAQNGDAISLLYTGIGSTHTDITRTGQRTLSGTFSHKYRSLMRFFTQFNDHKKQQIINLLLQPSIIKKRNEKVNDFHTTLIFSFKKQTQIQQSLEKIRDRISKTNPTIIIIFGYQNFQSSSIFDKLKCYFVNEKNNQKWQQMLCQNLIKYRYEKVTQVKSSQSWMGVFCRDQIVKNISNIKYQIFQTKANAQVILVKMCLDISSFAFLGVNCQNYKQFFNVFDQIHEKGFQITKLGIFQSNAITDLDYRIVIGNTGSQIIMNQKQKNDLISQIQKHKRHRDRQQVDKLISHLLDYDELSNEQQKKKNNYLIHYTQNPINFIPTGNRMLFWNQQGVILRVRQYEEIGDGNIVGILDYQIGRSHRSSLRNL